MVFIKKIVCLINDYKNSFGLELFCFDCKITSAELLKRVYFEVNQDNLDSVKEEINDIFVQLEVNKISCVVGVNSPAIFNETFIVPKLNINEENKACMLKLEKAYGEDFEKNYVFAKDKVNINKTNRRISYLMCKKDKYKSLLNKVEYFGFNIDKVVFSPVALASYTAKKHVISGDKTGLFINIDKNNTVIVVTKGSHLVDYKITNLGIYPIYECIAKFQERDTNEVISNPFGEKSEEVKIMIKEYFGNIMNDVKKICYHKDFTINEYYVHSELGLDDFIRDEFEKHSNIIFKTNIKLDEVVHSCFQALGVLRCYIQTLPVRVK